MKKSYQSWDKWARDIDENGDEKGDEKNPEQVNKPTCVFGKPMTEEEFRNRHDKDTPVIHK